MLSDHFPEDMSDVEWLAEVGQRGTDAAIRRATDRLGENGIIALITNHIFSKNC